MPRGRVRVLDEGKQREVCALLSAGCSLQATAHYVECAPNTIRREVARNPDFGLRLREARLQAQLTPLRAMRKAAASHWRAAAWMLERADPDHFGRRPAPAFRPKQAQTLKEDILAILSAEIENPFLLRRIKKQIQHLIEYSIDGVVRVERTNRQLRDAMRHINELEQEAEARGQAAFDEFYDQPRNKPPASPSGPTAASAPTAQSGQAVEPGPTAQAGPTGAAQPSNPEELDPETANVPVTWGDMTKVLQQLRKRAANANGKPGADPAEAHSADPHSTSLSPMGLPPKDSESSPEPSPPLDPNSLPG